MQKTQLQSKHKAVAPIIATLLMVAVAVVGGILIFVFAQGFFSDSQIQSPTLESVTLLGYDMRQILASSSAGVENHAGDTIANAGDASITDNVKKEDEEGAIYLKNTGSQAIVITSLKVNGKELTFSTTNVATSEPDNGEYVILDGTSTTNAKAINVLNPGQETTIVVSFDDDNQIKIGRAFTVQIETGNGAVFQFQLTSGIQKGGS